MSKGTITVVPLEEGTEEKYPLFGYRLQNCAYGRSVFIKVNHVIKFLERVQSKDLHVSCVITIEKTTSIPQHICFVAGFFHINT